MAVATASSAYILEDRASTTLKRIHGEATKTKNAAQSAANALDKIGSPAQLQRLERLERRLGNLASSAERMSTRVARSTSHMEGAIRRDTLKAEARVAALEARLDELGRKRATPSVGLDGYAATKAQLDSISRQLDGLAARSALIRVGALGSGGGGGGGARSGGFVGTGGAGVFTSRTRLLAGAAVTALPIVQALGGATVALGGSLAGAGLGAGAAGIAGGGALTAGIGSLVAVAKPAITTFKEVRKEQENYNEAVAQYGAASQQALDAQTKLDAAVRKAPAGARNLSREVDMLSSKWARVTAPGQSDILGLAAGSASRLRRASPRLGADANTVAASARSNGLNFMDFLTGQRSLNTIGVLSRAFAENLDEAEGTLESVVGTLGNVAHAAVPFFHEGMVFLEHWTGGWEKSTRDIGKTRRAIGGYVDDLKAWAHLTHAAFELAGDVLMGGRPAGRSAVEDLTHTLESWDRWVERNPEKIDRFFRNAVDDTAQIAKSVADIVHGLNSMATELRPIIAPLTRTASLLGDISGSLSPGAAGLTYLGLRSLRNFATARRVGGAAAGAGGAGAGGGAGGAGAGGGTAGYGPAAAGGLLPFLLGTRATAAAAGLTRTQRVTQAYGGAAYGARQAGASRLEASGAGLRGARTAIRRTGGARAFAGDVGGRAAGRLGRFALPVLALGGLTGAFGAPGSNEGEGLGKVPHTIVNTAQGIAAMFGIANPVLGTDERVNRGQARAQQFVTQLPGGSAPTTREASKAMRELRPELSRAEQKYSDEVFGGGKNDTAEALAYLKALRGQAQAYRDIATEAKHAREVEGNRQSRAKADKLTTSFGKAFDILAPRIGADKAFAKTLDDVYDKMRQMAPAGARILGQNTLRWAQAQARANPQLQGSVDRLTSRIERRFSRMGDRVQVINAKILSGSKDEWNRISSALSDPAERAQQRVTKAFTAIQQQAVGSLVAMGFTNAEAKGIVGGREAGGSKGRAADYAVKQGPGSTQAAIVGGSKAGPPAAPQRARGGRLPGTGLTDKVRMADGGLGAPGELVVARHTERDVDADLLASGKRPLGERVARNDKPHWATLSAPARRWLTGNERNTVKHATGGRLGPGNSLPAGQMVPIGGEYGGGQTINPSIAAQVRAILSKWHAQVSAGWAPVGTHAANSDHHWGGAVDLVPGAGGSWDQIDRLASWAEPSQGNPAHGFRWVGYTGDSGHGRGNHLHLSWPIGGHVTGIKGAPMSGGAGGDIARSISLRAPKSGLPGVPGALADRAASGYAQGLQAKINAHLGAGAAGGGDLGNYKGGVMTSRQVARLAESVGLPGVTFAQIAKGESGFNPKAIGHDPGGTTGLGLWQITTKYNDDVIARFGGRDAMLTPRPNARAAKAVYDRAGIGAWAGTRYMTDPNLHYTPGMDFGGWFGKGGSGTARKPTLIGIGDHPNGEDFTVTPRRLGPPSSRAGGGHGGARGLATVTIQHMDVHWAREGDLKDAMKDELRKAIVELTVELDEGIDDEDALVR